MVPDIPPSMTLPILDRGAPTIHEQVGLLPTHGHPTADEPYLAYSSTGDEAQDAIDATLYMMAPVVRFEARTTNARPEFAPPAGTSSIGLVPPFDHTEVTNGAPKRTSSATPPSYPLRLVIAYPSRPCSSSPPTTLPLPSNATVLALYMPSSNP